MSPLRREPDPFRSHRTVPVRVHQIQEGQNPWPKLRTSTHNLTTHRLRSRLCLPKSWRGLSRGRSSPITALTYRSPVLHPSRLRIPRIDRSPDHVVEINGICRYSPHGDYP